MASNRYKSDVVNDILQRDGDSNIRRSLSRDAYNKMLSDIRDIVRPDIPITFKHPDKLPNSYYAPADIRPSWLGGKPERIDSGIPSRSVIAHELGHANSIGRSRLKQLRRMLLFGLATGSSLGAYPLLRKYTKLKPMQAVAAASLATAGLGALHYWDVVDEESQASKNALDYLEEYNKSIPKESRVNVRAAKEALDYAKGTYVRGGLVAVPFLAALPLASYGVEKLTGKKPM